MERGGGRQGRGREQPDSSSAITGTGSQLLLVASFISSEGKLRSQYLVWKRPFHRLHATALNSVTFLPESVRVYPLPGRPGFYSRNIIYMLAAYSFSTLAYGEKRSDLESPFVGYHGKKS